jgi:spermidine synthase
MRKYRDLQTSFQTISVWKSQLATEFRVAGAVHASFHENRYLTGLAWDLIAAGTLLHPSAQPPSILMLGVAGGTALRTIRLLLPNSSLTGIDLDSELIDLARYEMFLDDTNSEIIIADAYSWLRQNKRKFDVIIDDLYLAGETDVFRSQHCDHNWIQTAAKSLAPNGTLVINLVIGKGHRTKQSQVRKNLLAHFPIVRSLHTKDSLNEVLVAGNNVSTASQLDQFLQAFKDNKDRSYWKRIKVRKLK